MEQKITFKYDRKDFFGYRVYTEDTAYLTPVTLKKAFTGLKKEKNVAIDIGGLVFVSIIMYWDTYDDYNNEIISVKFYERNNSWTVEKMAFSKAKKLINDYMKEVV